MIILIINHLHLLDSKLEQVQYNAALAITGAIKCTSCSKFYNELGLASLESRRRLRPLCFLHKIISNGSTKYSLMNNYILLNSSIKYIENSKSFSGPLI